MKEKYMHYHNQLGVREALKAFDLGECFMPEKSISFQKKEKKSPRRKKNSLAREVSAGERKK